MNKLERKINRLIKQYQVNATFLSIPMIIIGIIIHNVPCLLIATLLCGFPIFFRAYLALKQKIISIELLVTIATLGALVIGEYHESAIVTFLFQFGNYLELITLKKTRKAIKDLIDASPQIAYQKQGDQIIEVDVEDIEINDELVVRSGDQVAVDGIIISGEGYLDEASITGESKLVHKTIGDTIYANTLLDSGYIEMVATRIGEDTTYGKIVTLVEEAQDAKSPIEKTINQFSKYYTPMVIIFSLITLLLTKNIDTAITVLVLACPGALVIGAPIASVAGIGRGAKEGILFKGGDVIHTYAKSDLFLFDKTGTLTTNHARVVECIVEGDPIYLSISASVEKKSSHPLAKAIIEYVDTTNYDDLPCEIIKGKGIRTTYQNQEVYIGSYSFLQDQSVMISDHQIQNIHVLQEKGYSIVLVGTQKLEVIFAIADEIRSEAIEALKKLHSYGKLIMLTGDHDDIARQVGNQLGMDEIYSELLPEQKYALLEKMQKDHYVCFIGDGINDTPSITKANTGIAMGSGTDIAIDCSDLVLLNSNLNQLTTSLQIAKKTVAITYENIFIAVGTVFLLLIGLFLNYIHMSSGMLIHEGSILVVIFNSMRLLINKERKRK